MKSRSQLKLFVNSAHVQDLLNYCTVPLLLPSSSVHPWGFKDFSTTTGRTNLAIFRRFVSYVCPVLPCEITSFPLHVPYYPDYPVFGFSVSSCVSLKWTRGSR